MLKEKMTMRYSLFPAQHGRRQRGGSGPGALLRGAADRFRLVPAGERTFHVPVDRPGGLSRPHPGHLQPSLARPLPRTHGQSSFTQNESRPHVRGMSALLPQPNETNDSSKCCYSDGNFSF